MFDGLFMCQCVLTSIIFFFHLHFLCTFCHIQLVSSYIYIYIYKHKTVKHLISVILYSSITGKHKKTGF